MTSMPQRPVAAHTARFLEDDGAATAVEYGLMLALVAVAVIAGASLFGQNTGTIYNGVGGAVAAS